MTDSPSPDFTGLKATFLNCTLKRSPEPSHTQGLVDASAERLLSTGWSDNESFSRAVLEPLAAGGSAVIVAGVCPAERLEEIASNEKVTARLS